MISPHHSHPTNRVRPSDSRPSDSNGENRPIRWERDSDGTTLVMSYDHMGRRREKNNQRFFYDGYLQVVNFHSPTQTQSSNYYIWDCTEPIATRPLVWTKNDLSSYYNLDGNKNVSEVVAADGAVSAHYEYAPFGAVITQHGEAAAANPWRFSSEYAEDDTATVYYNYRPYEPVVGMWLCRDSIGELGSLNLYSFVVNSPMIRLDLLGRLDSSMIEYVKRNFSTTVKGFAGGGGGISVLITRESGKHCCRGGKNNGQLKEIIEWTVGGNVAVGIGIGAEIEVLGVGFDFQVTFASASADLMTAHIILDDCLDDVTARVDLLNITASPGVKEASLGLGMLASGTLSVYGGFELNLGVELGKNWHFYGGIYFDYDFSISGKFLWREYGGVGLDDLAPHQRIVLVDFGNGN